MDDLNDLRWIRELAASGRARSIREAARISGPEMARQVRTSPASLSRWERNLRTPRPEAAIRWARTLRGLLSA